MSITENPLKLLLILEFQYYLRMYSNNYEDLRLRGNILNSVVTNSILNIRLKKEPSHNTKIGKE